MLMHEPETVLVVAAHPDDEVLGCGGTIAAHAARGDSVHVLILSEGATSRRDVRDCIADFQSLQQLENAATQVSVILGLASLSFGHFPDNRLDMVPLLELTKVVESYIEKYAPTVVYTHHAGDLNIDHRAAHNATVTACRPLPSHPVKTVLFFEVPSSTEWQISSPVHLFCPNWFVDVSATLALKMQALQCYHTEMRDWPHSRSYQAVEHLARWRGASAGFEAAEAFMLGRQLCK